MFGYSWRVNQSNTIKFVLVDATYTEVSGLGNTFVLEVSKGIPGAFAASTGIKGEISDGWYYYVSPAVEADTIGPVAIKVTGAGIIQQNLMAEVQNWASIIWNFTVRTLTMSLASFRRLLGGTDIEILRGDTLSLSITGLGDLTTWVNIWFTVKDDKDDADAIATIQIDENTGLLFIAGTAATVAGNGSIVIDDVLAGNITITLEAVETAKLPLVGRYQYDIQWLNAAGVVVTLRLGRVYIPGDMTRVTS